MNKISWIKPGSLLADLIDTHCDPVPANSSFRIGEHISGRRDLIRQNSKENSTVIEERKPKINVSKKGRAGQGDQRRGIKYR